MPAAEIGPENPLPYFRSRDIDEAIDFDALGTPESDREGFGVGTGFRVLPYRMQDSYTRTRAERQFVALVLENEHLKVTVLPEVGGKVWSIVEKASGRELLESNPVFQPANLALRNAWTSGGIEWNLPQLGHHYLTCSPVHAAATQSPHGQGLRIYWWERVKQLTCQIDLNLDPRRPLLYAHVRVTNPSGGPRRMYWWTNIAVPEYPGGRVICPAQTAFKGREVVQVADGILTYPDRQASAYDLFFRIPPEQRPWELFVDAAGQGLMHASTAVLRGRKLFAWGMNPGSRHWNEFLSVPGRSYVEVQAGLCVTQSHTREMPEGAVWDWTEAIGPADIDPLLAHSTWDDAVAAGEAFVGAAVPPDSLKELDAEFAALASEPPADLLFAGSGWAALEVERARAQAAPSPIPPSMPVSTDDITEDQLPWLTLLRDGIYPEGDPAEEPGHFMIGDPWKRLLQDSIENGGGENWASCLHLGIMLMEEMANAEARLWFMRSIDLCYNGWGSYCMAMVRARIDDLKNSERHLLLANSKLPDVPGIAVELGKLLLAAGNTLELGWLVDKVTNKSEQLLVLECESALSRGQLERAQRILEREFAGVYEGDSRLCDLWWRLQMSIIARDEGVTDHAALLERVRATCSPPPWLDFRMTAGADSYSAPQTKEKQ